MESGRFILACPPKELRLGEQSNTNSRDIVKTILAKFGFEENIVLTNGGGLAVSPGADGSLPQVFYDGLNLVAFTGELTNVEELAQKHLDTEECQKSLTATAAEVLCALYSQFRLEGVLAKLRGTFSFVVYDSTQVRAFAARDPSGKIPLMQTFMKDGALVVSNFESDLLAVEGAVTEITAGHFVYGWRRCNVLQKFSPDKCELDAARNTAQTAAARALAGIGAIRSPASARRRFAKQTPKASVPAKPVAPTKSTTPAQCTTPVKVSAKVEVISTVTAPARTSHKESHKRAKYGDKSTEKSEKHIRAEASTWWRKEAEELKTRPTIKSETAPAKENREQWNLAVKTMCRIASKMLSEHMEQTKEEVPRAETPRGGMRRVPSCRDAQDMHSLGGMQRSDSLSDLQRALASQGGIF